MKHPILALLIIATLSANAQVRYLEEITQNVTKTSNVVYGWNFSAIRTAEDTSAPAPYVDSLRMDVYTPAGDVATSRPVILLSHAGSFLPPSATRPSSIALNGTKGDSCLVELCTRFAKLGYVAVAFEYRLGWNPSSPIQEIRASTIINAVYRAMHDAKSCIRYMKLNASTYGIDPQKIILGGTNSGAYVALAAGNLNQGSEIELFKFLDSTGNSFIDTTVWGNFEGTGGSVEQYGNTGVSSDFQLVLSLGGDVGDTSWADDGEVPVIAFHGVSDILSPYLTAIVRTGAQQIPIVEVSGPGDFIPTGEDLGNQDPLKGGSFCPAPASTDGIVYEGNYPFYNAGFEPWAWYDTVHAAQLAIGFAGGKTVALAYIDTIMDYFVPRTFRLLINNSYTDSCSTVGVRNVKFNNLEVELFPNPSQADIIIRVNDAKQTINSVELFDVAGKLIRTEDGKNAVQHTLKRNGVDPGIYFVNINFTSGAQTFKRIVFE